MEDSQKPTILMPPERRASDTLISPYTTIEQSAISCISWSGNHQSLVLVRSREIFVYNIHHIAKGPVTFRYHKDDISKAIFMHDNHTVISIDCSGMLCIWNSLTGDIISSLSLPGHLKDVDVTSDDTFLAVGSMYNEDYSFSDGALILLNTHNLDRYNVHRADTYISRVLFNQSGSLLAHASIDFDIRIFDMRSDRDIYHFKGDPEEQDDEIIALSFDGNQKSVYSLSFLSKLAGWDMTNPTNRKMLQLPNLDLSAATFAPGGHVLAYANSSTWYLAEDQENPETIPENTEFFYNSRGQLMFMRSEHLDAVYVWNWITTSARTVLPGHHGRIAALAWSADGHCVASADKTMVRLWRIGTTS